MSGKETKKNLEELEARKLDEDLLDEVSGGSISRNAKHYSGQLLEAIGKGSVAKVKQEKNN